MHVKICANQFCYGFNIFQKLGTVPIKTKIPYCGTVFGFSSKTSFFAGLGALFGTFLLNCASFFFNFAARTLHQLPGVQALTLFFFSILLGKVIHVGIKTTKSNIVFFVFLIVFFCIEKTTNPT